jgi:hypothetical protein
MKAGNIINYEAYNQQFGDLSSGNSFPQKIDGR